MKTITIRDLRQRWPETEKMLQIENEIIITRDGEPVARLARFEKPKAARKRWDPREHAKWKKKVWGNKVWSGSAERLAADRADRQLI